MVGYTASLTTTYAMSGLSLTGTGSASAAVPTNFLRIVGFPTIPLTIASTATSTAQSYLNVYLLIDVSASMLLRSTTAGITQMMNGKGCALACHTANPSTDFV